MPKFKKSFFQRTFLAVSHMYTLPYTLPYYQGDEIRSEFPPGYRKWRRKTRGRKEMHEVSPSSVINSVFPVHSQNVSWHKTLPIYIYWWRKRFLKVASVLWQETFYDRKYLLGRKHLMKVTFCLKFCSRKLFVV